MKAPVARPARLLVVALLALAAVNGCGHESAPSGSAATAPSALPDVAAEAGIDFVHTHGGDGRKFLFETMGSGVAASDFDGDGLPDLLFLQSGTLPPDEFDEQLRRRARHATGTTHRLYRNLGDLRFADVTAGSGLEQPVYAMGLAVGDVDADGDRDLFVGCYGSDQLFVNDGTAPLLPGAIPATVSVWTPEDGLVNLTQYLLDQNVTIPPGHPLTYVADVSPDGRYIVGQRGVPLDPTRPLEGFYIEMPPGLRYGVNSTAVANTLDLDSSGSGSIGNTFTAVTSGLPVPAGFILIGQGSWSFPYIGGEVLVDLTVPLVGSGPLAPDAMGVATTPVRIPNNPVFIGATLFFQSVGPDNSAPFGWAFSNGLKLLVRP